jgi:tetratricopeptide (TPR) repeat protein
MILAIQLMKKNEKILESGEFRDSIFKVVVNHNLGLIHYSIGKHLEGIHNIEKSYKLILDNNYSYLLRIKIVERLALAYLNIGELLKSFTLIKEAIFLRTNLLNLYESNPNFSFLNPVSVDKNDYLYQHYFLLSNNI